MFATFYSFKGGVGRSMALANVAEILAGWGYRVIACDWDLEAPGLERYLTTDESLLAQYRRQPGTLDLIQEYKATLARPPADLSAARADANFRRLEAETGAADGESAAPAELYLRRPASYATFIPPLSRELGGWIRFLSVGRHGGEHSEDYVEAVRGIDWKDFYESWAGDAYFEFFRRDLNEEADIVLVDSRTGITEIGGVCTHHFADLVLLISAANFQNIEGTRWIAEMLDRPELKLNRGGRALAVLPVAARVEISAEAGHLADFRDRFAREFSKYVPEVLGGAKAELLARTEIPYIPKYSFTETIVAREEKKHRELYAAYQAIADAIVRWGEACGGLRRLERDQTAGVVRTIGPATPARVVAESAALVPKGEFFFSAAPGDAPLARRLVAALREAGAQIWSVENLAGSASAAVQIGEAVARSAGYLLLLPREAEGARLDAEFNLALQLQARGEGYRVLVLIQAGSGPVPPMVKRFQTVQLPAEPSAEIAATLLSELLPAQTLVPEQTAESLTRSLQSPAEKESRFFFGRDEEVREVLRKIEVARQRGPALLALTGASGVGKSSLLRAGVIPAVQRGWLAPAGEAWKIAYVRLSGARFAARDGDQRTHGRAVSLEREVLAGIAAAVDFAGSPPAAPRGAAEGLDAEWEAVLGRVAQTGAPLLLILDNAEELLRQHAADPQDERAFADRLVRLNASCPAGVFVILVVRDSWLPDLRRLVGPLLGPDQIHQLPPLNAEAIHELLGGSARLLGVRYEPGLLEVIHADAVRNQAGGRTLGILLRGLWEQRAGDLLTHGAYNALDGIEGVLVESAEELLRRLMESVADAGRVIITNLIHPRTGALLERSREDAVRVDRRSKSPDSVLRLVTWLWGMRNAEMIELSQPHPDGEEALAELADWSVLVSTAEGRVRLANERLTKIDLVRDWLRDDEERLNRRVELHEAATLWHTAGRPPDLLARGSVGRRFVKWTAPGEIEREFMYRAIFHYRKVMERVFIGYIVVGLLVGIGVGFCESQKTSAPAAPSSIVEAPAIVQPPLDPATASEEQLTAEVARLQRMKEQIESLRRQRHSTPP